MFVRRGRKEGERRDVGTGTLVEILMREGGGGTTSMMTNGRKASSLNVTKDSVKKVISEGRM